ncbi:Uncharacterised protein [Escherichia coli]|nr:Uncharacterised protein [Escherichia coli]CAD6085342.1 Uncharacterised protein [Escherichia coli]CAD6148691.1 Uncharacterised protein [Escherichia coli]
MLGGADNPNGELPSYITGADMHEYLTDFKSLNGTKRWILKVMANTNTGCVILTMVIKG